jgi:tetratricopeptide (TPR) repeat protein
VVAVSVRSRAAGLVIIACAVAGAGWLAARQFQAHTTRSLERARTAAAALEERQRSDQLRVWHAVHAADSNSAIAQAQLAGLYVQRARETGDESNYARAEWYARRSLSTTTTRNAKTYVTLATILLAGHRFAEAREVAAAAVAADPDQPIYRALTAEIDLELGRYDSATAGFALLHRHRGHLSIAPRLARWAEAAGRSAYARRLLENAREVALSRSDLQREQVAWFVFRLGDYERRHGRLRRAETLLREALDINPGDYRALRVLAELELVRGRTKKARDYATRAVSRSRTPETLATLAETYRAGGDNVTDRAITSAIRTAVGSKPARFERAWYSHELERARVNEELLATLRDEAEGRPDAGGLDLLAWAQYKAGMATEANATITGALSLGPGDPLAWYHAGMIRLALGDSSGARAYLKSALNLNPRFHWEHGPNARALVKKLRPGQAVARPADHRTTAYNN